MINSLYIATAGTVSLDFREDGNITGIMLSCANVAVGAVEVSFNSSSSFTTNDTTGVVCGTIADGAGSTIVSELAGLSEPVQVGERIFLHVTGALNVTRVFIFTDSKSQRAATRRR